MSDESEQATPEELARRKRRVSLEIFLIEDPEDSSKSVMQWDMVLDEGHAKGQTMEEMSLIVFGAELALQEIKGVGLLSVQHAKRQKAVRGNGSGSPPKGIYLPQKE